jgi:hypothetical protein
MRRQFLLLYSKTESSSLYLLGAQPPIGIRSLLLHSQLNLVFQVSTEPLFDHNGIVNIGKNSFAVLCQYCH